MPLDYYPNLTLPNLDAVLLKLQNRQISGGIVEVSATGVRTVRKFDNLGNARTEVTIKRVLYSMYLRAKGTPQAASYQNPYAQMITRTRARYSL